MADRNRKRQLFYRIGAACLVALMIFGVCFTVLQFIL